MTSYHSNPCSSCVYYYDCDSVKNDFSSNLCEYYTEDNSCKYDNDAVDEDSEEYTEYLIEAGRFEYDGEWDNYSEFLEEIS